MTEQKACTLCGAGGHSAAQCNWNQGIALLSSAEADYLAAGDYAAAERIEAFLASQQCQQCAGTGYDCPDCIAAFDYEQADGAQGEREDVIADRNYVAGMQAGWNFAESADEAGFKRAIDSRLAGVRAAIAQPSQEPDLERSHFADTLRRIDLVLAAIRSHDFHGIINSTIGKDWREQVAEMRGELRDVIGEHKEVVS